MRFATKDDLVELFGEAHDIYSNPEYGDGLALDDGTLSVKLGNGLHLIGDALTSGAYYTTEMVGTDEVLTLVYEMVEE